MSSERYIRQTSLKEFGPKAQHQLSEANVLVVGAGGLGLPILQYLNAMGVGTLGIVEQDLVEITNLQRQVLYSEDDIGKSKLQLVIEKLKAQNSGTTIKSFDTFLVPDNAIDILSEFDVIVDATDNFPTRYLINDACVLLKKPFVYGALHGFEGQVSVFNYQGGPTYRCLFPDMPSSEEIPDCNENGVLGVIPGVIGTLQALEVVKVLTSIGEVLSGKLLLFNGLEQSYIKIDFPLHPENLNIKKIKEDYRIPDCTIVNNVTIEKFQNIMSSNKPFQIIDVRTNTEFANYHLPGAKNIPLAELPNRVSEISTEIPVYVICQSGNRSSRAAKQIQSISISSKIYNILGGIRGFLIHNL